LLRRRGVAAAKVSPPSATAEMVIVVSSSSAIQTVIAFPAAGLLVKVAEMELEGGEVSSRALASWIIDQAIVFGRVLWLADF
jgi:hypothetical protein